MLLSPPPPPPPPAASAAGRLSNAVLLASMLMAVLAVAALAFWDEERESRTALDDFAQEQAMLAESAGADLATRLAAIERDARLMASEAAAGRDPSALLTMPYLRTRLLSADRPPASLEDGEDEALPVRVPLARGGAVELLVSTAQLFGGLRQLERPGSLRVLVQPPSSSAFRTTDARSLQMPELAQAFAQGARTFRLGKDKAPRLGLPSRTAMVGLAHVNAGVLGHWGVLVSTSAERERDRERRARGRLVLAVILASGLVLAFGGAALALQRKELALMRKLELEELTRENDERLARLSKAATTLTLASGMAHELGTPLGVIVGRAEQLSSRLQEDEKALKSVRVIVEQAERIHEVIRGFLRLARGGSPTFERVAPAAVVRGAAELVQHRFQKACVRLEVSMSPELSPLVCDVRLLEHALINLLLNACDASPRGGRVEVRVEEAEQCARFLVTDEGSGIPASVAAQVVTPFFTTKPEGVGTGLGLAVANEIAKSHHGTLGVGPNGARGTRAVLQIPFGGGGHITHG